MDFASDNYRPFTGDITPQISLMNFKFGHCQGAGRVLPNQTGRILALFQVGTARWAVTARTARGIPQSGTVRHPATQVAPLHAARTA
jgi:hypothetical protein